MLVSKSWLKELVEIENLDEVVNLLPLRTIGIKAVNEGFIELDMKGYNRADLLSIRGVAREVSAITDSKVNFEDLSDDKYIWIEQNLPKVNLNIENENLAPVYCVAKIENLKVEQSDDTWVEKLNSSGVKSINNLVDITNLIMVEYGQPLHAFDADRVKDQKIIVRTAKAGEKIVTLDDKERKLYTSDLLITDPEKALGIAGVMGGENSEVSNSTTTILLEAAIFDPVNIRKTASRLSLYSEASKRFQHGLTKKGLLLALNTAISMYQQLGGSLTAISLVGNLGEKPRTIILTHDKINSLIGVEIPSQQLEKSLQSLGFHLRGTGINSWEVKVPYYRLDIDIEEDLVEEVARIYGYEKIPAKELVGEKPKPIDQSLFNSISDLKQKAESLGLTEVQTYSFYSSKVLSALGFDDRSKNVLIKISNSISSETEYMRMNLWPNLVEIIDKNLRHRFKDIAIFEVGKIYYLNEKEEPDEKYVLAMALLNNSENPLAELYTLFIKLNQDLKLDIVEAEHIKGESAGLFHPNRYIQLKRGDKIIGSLAEVHKRVTDQFGIGKRVAILQIHI